MDSWLPYSLIALFCYGIVGALQKITTNRISADLALLWYSIGYLSLLPWFFHGSDFSQVSVVSAGLGVLAGFIARLGEWFLFASLRNGAKASVAVPLTATYPVITLLLAVVVLREALTSTQWLGIALALSAGVLMSYETPQPTESSLEND